MTRFFKSKCFNFFILFTSFSALNTATAQAESEELSPRSSGNIINLLLNASETAVVRDAVSGVILPESIEILFDRSMTNPDGTPAERFVSANCRFIGGNDLSDRDESCFVIINDRDGRQAYFGFIHSAMTRFSWGFVFSPLPY